MPSVVILSASMLPSVIKMTDIMPSVVMPIASMFLSVITHHKAEFFMLNVLMISTTMLNLAIFFVIMLGIIMLSVAILNAILLTVITLSVHMSSVVIQSVTMLNVVAPPKICTCPIMLCIASYKAIFLLSLSLFRGGGVTLFPGSSPVL